MQIKLIISYDGSSFLGFQEGGPSPTVEETLREVLETIYQEPLKLEGASRTDAGVHATGQVVCFKPTKKIEDPSLLIRINKLLPKSIRVLSYAEVKKSFHPTLDALGKEYHYHICNEPIQFPHMRHYSWHVYAPLDLHLMKKAACFFLGTHDFASLTNTSVSKPKETVRTLRKLAIYQEGSKLRIEVEGDNFLYKMVRNIVGTLVYAGMGKLSLEDVQNLLSQKDRRLAGITAPAHGLILHQVFYRQ